MKKHENLFLVVLLLVLTICSSAFAQRRLVIPDLPDLIKEKEVLVEDYPELFREVIIDSVEHIDSKHSKVYYTKLDTRFETIVNSDRKDLLLVARCAAIPVDKLPEIVRDSFEKSDQGKHKIKDAFIVTTPYAGDFYRIDIDEPNGSAIERKSLFYSNMGAYHSPPY